MAEIYEITKNKTLQSNELLEILTEAIDDHATNMDYFTIIGVIEMLKDSIKEDMME